MSETIQIHLNSKYATSYNNNFSSDCNFTLPLIEVDEGYYIHLSVQSAIIPYSFYNIDSTNNTLYYQEIIVDANGNQTGTINTSINISQGNYNALQLGSYLQSNLPRTTVSYSTITGKYIFTNTTYNFIIKSQYSTCLSLIGCNTSNDVYNTSILKSLTTYSPANLSPRQCICISSNLPTGNLNNQIGNNRSIICSIPVSSQPFSLIVYNNPNNAKFNLYSNTINYINIRLADQNNNPINLNGQYFSITLQLDIIKFLDE
jgi:hypothetical protein